MAIGPAFRTRRRGSRRVQLPERSPAARTVVPSIGASAASGSLVRILRANRRGPWVACDVGEARRRDHRHRTNRPSRGHPDAVVAGAPAGAGGAGRREARTGTRSRRCARAARPRRGRRHPDGPSPRRTPVAPSTRPRSGHPGSGRGGR